MWRRGRQGIVTTVIYSALCLAALAVCRPYVTSTLRVGAGMCVCVCVCMCVCVCGRGGGVGGTGKDAHPYCTSNEHYTCLTDITCFWPRPIILASTKIVPSRSLPTNAVLPLGNKQHLILSADSVQLNGKMRLDGRTGNNVGRRGAGVWVSRLSLTRPFSYRQL
jgi:hypothetical protein